MRNATIRTILLAAALVLAGPVLAQLPVAREVAAGALAPADVEFLRTADAANVDQMTFAARILGRSRTVARSLAENVRSTHRKADIELRKLASIKHVDLDHAMSERARAEADDLLRQDIEVDRHYAAGLLRDSDDLVRLYRTAREQSPDGDIRAYARKVLEGLYANRQEARELVSREGWVAQD